MSKNPDNKSGMIEIRDVLKNEFQRFSSINTVLKETSEGFNKIDSTYTNYGSEMNTAKNHLIKLKRREFFENLFIYIGLVFYFICVAYVMLRRFPIHRIIYLLYFILEKIVGYGINIGELVYNLTGINKGENYYQNTTNLTELINLTLPEVLNNNTYTELYESGEEICINNFIYYAGIGVNNTYSHK